MNARKRSSGKNGRGVAIGAVMAAALAAAAGWTVAADHVDSPLVENEASIDIADTYVFRSPADPGNVVLAMTLHGFIPPAEAGTSIFDPDVLYQFKIDTDGDAVEDRVVQAFVTGTGSAQTMHFRGPAVPPATGTENRVLAGEDAVTVSVSTGGTARVASGDGLTVFAGVRDDPFFFDFGRFQEILAGEATAFRDPGVDAFAGFNVYAIVVEMPAARLGATQAGVWATASRRR